MTLKFWKNGDEAYNGDSVEGAIEISEEEYKVIVLNQVTEIAKTKRDNLIKNIEWRRSRHEDEVLLGLTPTEPLLPILEYIQALRDITSQEGFPSSISWPTIGD